MKVHFVIGPTASGKSGYAVSLAQTLGTEVVGADSVQIYRHFNIGSAKITSEEMQGVAHHLIDFLEPNRDYTVMDYRAAAFPVLEEIRLRHGTAVVCGGTGLYIDALLYEFDPLPPADPVFRAFLNEKNLEELIAYASALGMTLQSVETANKRRVIRAIEIFKLTGAEKGEFQALRRTKIEPQFHFLFPPRDVLYGRIHARVDEMIRKGLVEETSRIVSAFGSDSPAFRSIGYKQALEHLHGEYDEAEMAERIKQATRRYAKRQMTWFKKYKRHSPPEIDALP